MATLNKVSEFNKLDTLHKDLIHDISFNYYGSMLATCSSDQTIKIWKCIDNDKRRKGKTCHPLFETSEFGEKAFCFVEDMNGKDEILLGLIIIILIFLLLVLWLYYQRGVIFMELQ